MSRSLLFSFIFIVFFESFSGVLNAQERTFTSLMKISNLPRPGDTLIKQQVDYIDPGIAGTNILWDFRSVHPVNDYYIVSYRSIFPDSCSIGGFEHGTIYSYILNMEEQSRCVQTITWLAMILSFIWLIFPANR